LELIAMFDGLFQPMHLFALLLLALFVFGPKRLPELGKAIGEGIRSFKSGMDDSPDETREV
jgi:sec-independent protein translocase protein TatA